MVDSAPMPIRILLSTFLPFCLFVFPIQAVLTQVLVEIQPGTKITLDSGASIRVMGDLINHGALGDSAEARWGKLELSHSRRQTLSGSTPIQVDSLIMNNAFGVQLGTSLRIAKTLVFQSGKMTAPWADSLSAYVHFLPGAQWQQTDSTSYVQGWVHKSGDEPFVFPVGSAQAFRPIEISAPDVATARFAAYYHQANPNAFGYPIQSIDPDCGLTSMSNREFWMLNRWTPSQPVQVTLHYDSASVLPDPTLVMVSRWNGSAWESHGNGGWQANGKKGTITSGTGCGFVGTPAPIGNFSPFGFGGAGPTPLPILFSSFESVCLPGGLEVQWITQSEWNNQYFLVEGSADAATWTALAEIPGAGNSQTPKIYNLPLNDFQGYIRITQVDFNGQSTSYGPWFADCPDVQQTLRVWPNPTTDAWQFFSSQLMDVEWQLSNVSGSALPLKIEFLSDQEARIDASALAPGVYFLSGNGNLPQKLVKIP